MSHRQTHNLNTQTHSQQVILWLAPMHAPVPQLCLVQADLRWLLFVWCRDTIPAVPLTVRPCETCVNAGLSHLLWYTTICVQDQVTLYNALTNRNEMTIENNDPCNPEPDIMKQKHSEIPNTILQTMAQVIHSNRSHESSPQYTRNPRR
jgi:hypothetical protein